MQLLSKSGFTHTHTHIYSTYLLPSNISIFHSDCYYRKYHRALRIAMRYSLLFRTRYQSFGTDPISELAISHIKFIFLLLKSLFCWPDTVKSTSLCVCRIPLKLTDIGHKSVKRSFSLARIPVLFVFHASNLRFLVHPRHPHGFALAPKAVAVGRDLRSAIGGPGGGVRHAAGDHLERWLGYHVI